MQLSTKLRSLRKASGLTLAQVSQKAGLSVSFISDIERGRTKASLDSLNKLAICYKIPTDELLRNTDLEPTASQANLPPGLADFLSQIPDADQAIVDLMISSESRAISQNQTVKDWTELYYSLKRIYNR